MFRRKTAAKAPAKKPKVVTNPKPARAKPQAKKPAAKPRAVKATAAKQRPKPMQKEINKLPAKGKKAGKLDQREIFGIIPDKPENAEILDDLYDELATAEIDLIPATEPRTE